MKLVGTLRRTKQGAWALKLEPHVAIRAKRVFAQLKSQFRDELQISDTVEAAVDLEWFLVRYPLKVSSADRAYLAQRAQYQRDTESLVHQLVSGITAPREFQLALPPRAYQKVAAELALRRRSLLLADDLGSGKTCSAICMLVEPDTRPALVCTLSHLTTHWAEQLQKFAPALRVHTLRGRTPYNIMGGAEGQRSLPGMFPDVIITSYNRLAGWTETLAPLVRSVVFDEVQDLRRGEKSQKGAAAYHISDHTQYRLGLTATPIYNLGSEIWHVLRAVSPETLGEWNEFLTEWCGESDMRGRSRLRDARAFGTYLRSNGAMLRRTRKELGTELPPVTRVVHEIDADEDALAQVEGQAIELARILLSQNQTQRAEKMQAGGELNNLVRQATGVAKAPHVAEFVKMLLESSDEPVIVFAWHRAVYDILLEKLKEYSPLLYTGTESTKQKDAARQKFLDGETRLMIMSLRSGLGLDGLQGVCRTAVFAELDWSPGVIEQCIGRLDRDGQLMSVLVYYLLSMAGSDPLMADMLQVKRGQVEGIRNPDGDLIENLETDGKHIKRLAAQYLEKLKHAS